MGDHTVVFNQTGWSTYNIESHNAGTRRHTIAQEHNVCGLEGHQQNDSGPSLRVPYSHNTVDAPEGAVTETEGGI